MACDEEGIQPCRSIFFAAIVAAMNNQIIVISGSLRKASFTTAVCRALVGEMNATRNALVDNKIEFVLRDCVRELPTYDGDLDTWAILGRSSSARPNTTTACPAD